MRGLNARLNGRLPVGKADIAGGSLVQEPNTAKSASGGKVYLVLLDIAVPGPAVGTLPEHGSKWRHGKSVEVNSCRALDRSWILACLLANGQ